MQKKEVIGTVNRIDRVRENGTEVQNICVRFLCEDGTEHEALLRGAKDLVTGTRVRVKYAVNDLTKADIVKILYE